jgi:two-component system OmpR family response regulator/two-component system response regulator QseB
MMTARILVVDDDTALAEMIGIVLRSEGFEPSFCGDGSLALAAFRETKPDLVLLDLMLPGKDGIQVCAEIRTESGVPIIMLTAKSDSTDVVRGLESGADDYVVKPVDLNELGARLRALVRRSHGQPQECLSAQDIVLDPAARSVLRSGSPITLSAREFDLLHTLILNAGRVLSREQLEQHLYSWGQEVDSNAIEVHIHHLRRKIGGTLIQTVRGVGYMFQREGHPS